MLTEQDIAEGEVVAFYNGLRTPAADTQGQEEDWEEAGYRILLGAEDEDEEDGDEDEDGDKDKEEDHGVMLDIPAEYRSTQHYCATLAHKCNHSFVSPNCRFSR